MRISLWAAGSGRVTSGACRHGALFIALLVSPPLFALNPSLSIGQYLHTSWTQEEGSPLPPIQALAQTTDGYLWLGASKGLRHFDGMRFVEWSPVSGPALPSQDIRCLRPAAGDGLWIATANGICRVVHSRVIRYPSLDKLPCSLIASMLEDRSGKLWMLNTCPKGATLARLSPDGTLQTFGTRDGLPGQALRTLFEDRQGNLWIGTSSAICQWSPGAPAVCSKGPSLDVVSIAEAGGGQLVIADDARKQSFRFANGQLRAAGPRVPDSSFSPGAMLCDRDGNVWVGTSGQGLLRIRENRVDRFTRSDGLSSNSVMSVWEDHEGDIWVATARGVDRFRDPQVQLFSTLDGLSGDLVNAVYAARDGAIWIGTAGAGLNRLADGRVSRYSTTAGLPSATVLSLYEDPRRAMWVGTSAGLAVQSGDRFVEVITARGEHLTRVFNVGGDRSGTVWLADGKRGLFVIRGRVACPVAVPGLDSSDIYGLLVAVNGSVWLGHYAGGVTVVKDGIAKYYDTSDGLGGAPVRALYEDWEGAVWVGTANGLSVFRDSHWTIWTTAQALPEGGVQSIVEDETGGLLLLTPTGILRVLRSSLNAPSKALPYILYGRTEGLRLSVAMTNPRLARARDGRLWISTQDGVATIDPARVKSNPVPPPVVVEQLIVDGKPVDITRPGEISFRGHDLQIGYNGISLMVPERVHIRYRMYGLDSGWTEAGTRRNVTYVNLPPKRYRFKVIASNNDGVWNNDGAELALRVDPYFYQTRWFALLCLTAALLAVWSVHRLRMRRVVTRLQLIGAERARVSRELHDSLLQGFAGVVYLLEAAARQFEAAPKVSKQRLEQALDQADQSLREARQMIVSMRIPALENSTLVEALRATLEQMVCGLPVNLQFEVKGRARQGPYEVEANIFLIAREAVTNSMSHASPTRVRSELRYTQKELHLTIEDDGAGFDPEIALTKAGHFGFRGMRERARQIGGRFSVESAAGRGTTIEVAVPWKK
jgi:signal transduction histidine kinase/ligand-binding sensor domain-containing protein